MITILDCIDEIAAVIPKMTIKRAKHFCDLYEALHTVICDFNDPSSTDIVSLHRELRERMQKIRELEGSIVDYKTDKTIVLDEALEALIPREK